MPLREELERQGNWLFRRRAFLPLLGAPILALAFHQVLYPLINVSLRRAERLRGGAEANPEIPRFARNKLRNPKTNAIATPACRNVQFPPSKG
jgi:hypothetical protein